MGIGSQDLVRWWTALWRRAPDAPMVAAVVSPRSTARTDVGRVRSVNEDRVLDLPERALWAVADGMGGLSAGDVAAGITVATLATLGQMDEAGVRDALARANAEVLEQGAGRSGSTIVAAHLDGDALTVFWAGDSRAYHARGAHVRQVTRDHSLVQDLVDAGLLDDDKREAHPRANVVTRALGVAADLVVDTVQVTLVAGDRVLLCSDGVSRSLDPRDIAARGELETVADRLLAAALERDGSDNASLVLIEV